MALPLLVYVFKKAVISLFIGAVVLSGAIAHYLVSCHVISVRRPQKCCLLCCGQVVYESDTSYRQNLYSNLRRNRI